MTESTNTVHVGATPPSPHTEARFVKVEQDVIGLKSDIGDIKSTMQKGFEVVGAQITAKGQTNWTAVSIVAGLLISGAGWAWGQYGGLQQRLDTVTTKFDASIAAMIADQKSSLASVVSDQRAALAAAVADQKAALAASVAEQKAQAAQFESRAEITAKDGYVGQIGDLKAQIAAKDAAAVGAKVDRVAADVDELKKIVVPLSTHQELWSTQHRTNDALAAQIDENRRALADIATPRDAISRIYKRLDDDAAHGRTAARPD